MVSGMRKLRGSLLLLIACGCGEAAPEVANAGDEALSAVEATPATVVHAASSSTVTVSGRVFYNDRRQDGLFAARRTPSGAVGTRCDPGGRRDDGTPCSLNWLGAQYMVVDVYERDEGYFAPTAWDCKHEDLQASATVGADGRFSVTFTPRDDCDSDDLDDYALVVKVRTRYCGEWCFSLNEEEDDPYALVHPGASASNPLLVERGDQVGLNDLFFHPASEAASSPGLHAKAANYYASLVDTILTVHRDNGIPFYEEEFGEIQYVFPSVWTSTATTKSASKVVIHLDEEAGWEDGKTSAHEYGHVMMLRAWEGDYGFDGIGISANDVEIAPSRQIAFKEAWAEFVARAVFPLTRGCDRAGFDDNETTPLPGELGEGAQWRLNVTKALCDWYESRPDDDLGIPGPGDHFASGGLYSMWFNLRNMYLTAEQYGGDYAGEGLWFCDYVDYYLEVRKSAAAVGAAAHDAYVSDLADLVYQNNIGCYLPSP
jgi:hypothetical protein